MALQKPLTIGGTGIVVPEAYFKVEGILLDARMQCATIQMWVYKDAATRAAEDGEPLPAALVPNGSASFTASGEVYNTFFRDSVFENNRTNPRRQAYRFLVTQEFFGDAVSV